MWEQWRNIPALVLPRHPKEHETLDKSAKAIKHLHNSLN
jgi:hypothetical protein